MHSHLPHNLIPTEHELKTDLPFLDHRAQFVGRHVHAVEVGQHVATLHLLRDKLELTERNLVILQISQ